ncbi:hypothetical protein UA08_06174 [Talaromyces atroroseus]|uniref:MARVEL domain-containing protein n=1 Tax=Talaromyces atroroseus TaxID=1441469 RepID=A0A225AJZ2_TALAT|nr:hypothetical protein UA08_06174 [Talaromyces atroroseus]OKL58614.1 hypothetical protein UA08_06174 [Talaromyces atroroseus]
MSGRYAAQQRQQQLEEEEDSTIFYFFRKSRHGILGVCYHVFRAAEIITLVAIIGLVGQFISDMDGSSVNPPSVLVGILSLVCLAALYLVILVILFWDFPHKIFYHWPILIDSAILAGFVAVAVVSGRPLAYLRCSSIGGSSGSASSFISSLASKVDKGAGEVIYSDFIAASRQVCNEMKAIWGLVIADCIFFALTVIIGIFLFFMTRSERAQKGQKGQEDQEGQPA